MDRKIHKKRTALVATTTALSLFIMPAGSNAAANITYMQAVSAGTTLTPILTSGDLVGTYVVPGIPDGVGTYMDGKKLRVITNHEWSNTNAVAAGRTSAMGVSAGSFMSSFHYDVQAGSVTSMRDFISDVTWYNYANSSHGITPGAPAGAAFKDSYGSESHSRLLNRFCSATLSSVDGLYDKASKTGYEGHVYFAGEEGGDESRAFAATMDGELVQLPRLGLASWENLVPSNSSGKSTVIFGLEDGSATDSQLWMYLGTKSKKGKWFEKAGLNNGKNYVLSATSAEPFANDNEFRTKYGKNKPVAVNFTEVDWSTNGVTQNAAAREKGIELARVEDGHFDPKNPNDFYFVTTESNKDPIATAPNPATPTVSRDGGALWRLRLADVKNPLKGATLEMLLNGGEEPLLSKPDNIVVDDAGNVLIQEDPGNNALVARIVAYNIASKKVAVVAKFKDEYFAAGSTSFITQDEESSGIVDVSEFMRKGKSDKAKYYIYVAQIHASTVKARPDLDSATATWLPQAVEGGQWYVMKIDNWGSVYGG